MCFLKRKWWKIHFPVKAKTLEHSLLFLFKLVISLVYVNTFTTISDMIQCILEWEWTPFAKKNWKMSNKDAFFQNLLTKVLTEWLTIFGLERVFLSQFVFVIKSRLRVKTFTKTSVFINFQQKKHKSLRWNKSLQIWAPLKLLAIWRNDRLLQSGLHV